MDLEIDAIERNATWSLVDLPSGNKKIGVKWLFKTKLNEQGEVDKLKARLVAKGYKQKHGIDYTEVFALVARMETVRMIVALEAQKDWKLYQLDVKSAFLHGELNEHVYVDQPRGYEKKGNEHKVYKLHKALYGLKQAPQVCFSRIESWFIDEGFERCANEQTLFTRRNKEGKLLIVSIYVDDLIYTGDDEDDLMKFKASMMNAFEMTDLGMMKFFLGIEISQDPEGIFVCQKAYAQEIMNCFGMEECNPVNNPIVPGQKHDKDENDLRIYESYFKQIVGSLIYLTTTCPDLMYSVSLISRFMANPTEVHLQAAKKILRYLKGSWNYEILYKKRGPEELVI